MKKLLLVLLLVLAVIGLQACKEGSQEASNFEPYVIEEFELTIDEKYGEVKTEKNRDGVFLYKDIVGYNDNKAPIYKIVASRVEYEIGDTVTVVNIQLENFDYNVIKLEDGVLDTSWHTYLETI